MRAHVLYDAYVRHWSVMGYFPVASRIPRKRFLEVQGYFHFTNNDTIIPISQPGFDTLAKVRPIVESVRHCFLENYHPHKENAIDEAMVPFKGRSSLKQYVPLKPVRRGFKIWVKADSNNGYI